MVKMSKTLQQALNILLSEGYQISPKAYSILQHLEDPLKAVEEIKEYIKRERLEEILIVDEEILKKALNMGVEERKYESKEVSHTIEIRLISPKTKIQALKGKDALKQYYKSRMRKLREIMLRRLDFQDTVTIREAILHNANQKVKIVGLIHSIKQSKNGTITLLIEDETGRAKVILKDNIRKIREIIDKNILNICVGVEGVVKNNKIIADEISLPEIPKPPELNIKESFTLILTSDLHVGSVHFMEKKFEEFTKWIKENREKYNIKAVIIAGDLVDGVSKYIHQEKELKIKDVEKQYEKALELLSSIPSEIKIILIPGDHDATESPLPPYMGFKREVLEEVRKYSNLIVLPEPVHIEVNGVRILITHGKTLEHLASQREALSSSTVLKLMQLVLRIRHLAPLYNLNSRILPTAQDVFVIDEIPHILQIGHLHIQAVGCYKSILMVSSGTWQKQTLYQKVYGIKPTPGRVMLIKCFERSIKPKILAFI